MTEEEWLKCADPTPMLEFLRGKVSNRKLRLFAVACCRHVWQWLLGYSREAVKVAERYADKQATRAELTKARNDVWKDFGPTEGYDSAMACAQYAAAWGLWEAVTGVVRTASGAPYTREWLQVRSAKRKTRAMHAAAGRAQEQSRLAERKAQCAILREQFSPFRPMLIKSAWRTDTAFALAQQMYDSRDFSAMPILADALQDAGCDNEDVLNHCRETNAAHVRGCWVVDLILDKV
jgi:hypothetical protein